MNALDSHIETIARRLLGEPNPKFSTRDQWRYGNKGSLSVEIIGEKRSQWFDHEDEVGGGPFAFIKRYAGLDDAGARKWIADELGIKDDPPKHTRPILYDYVDEVGTLLFQVVRVPATAKREKFFYQRQPDGQGGWKRKLDPKTGKMKLTMEGARLVPYHLDRLVAARKNANGKPPRAYINEGEKDADNLANARTPSGATAGFLTTTSPGGASKGKPKWRPEYNQYFAGFDVVILPDNDEAGRAHAEHIARNLAPIAAAVRIVALPGLPEKGDVSDWIPHHSLEEFEALVEQTPLWTAPPEPMPREPVELVAGELPYVIDQVEKALIKRDDNLFEHNSRPSYTALEDPPTNQLVANPRRVLFAYGEAHFAEHSSRHVDYVRKSPKGDLHSIDCPPDVPKAYLQRQGRRHLRLLRGVISTPTLRCDGSILDTPGYDPQTKLFYDPCGVAYPPIPKEPTQAQIDAALATLKAPIAKFPFVPGDPEKPELSASRSVVLSAILTGIIRGSLATAPLHGFSSPVAGAGKSKLGNVVAITVMGRTVHPVAETKDTKEFEKRAATALIRGDQIIGFDNCAVPVGGGLLSQALSEPSITIRNFGKLKDIIVENTALIIANGVNLVFSGEVIRRCLKCSIDPLVEKPETLTFEFEPLSLVTKTRPQMVVAALTLLRAYHVAGRPSQKLTPLGSFDHWSDWPRATLVWLGEPDPCLTQQTIRDADPDVQKHAALLIAWHDFKGNEAASLSRVIEEAQLYVPDKPLRYEQGKALLAAMTEIADLRNNKINTHRLGNWIAEKTGKIIKNLRFERESSHAGVATWKVVVIPSKAG